MYKNDRRKRLVILPEKMIEEMKTEAARLDRSLSWIAQRAWKIAHKKLQENQTMDDEYDFDA